MKFKMVLAAAVLAMTVGVTSCSSAEGWGSTPADERAESTPTPTAGSESGILFPTADFEPMLSTEELAGSAELVALGRLSGAVDGPLVGKAGDEFSDIRLVVLEIEPAELAKGGLAATSDGLLYLRIPFPAGADILLDTIPEGSAVVVYANEVDTTGEGSDQFEVVDGNRGAPTGQSIYAVSSPQGLVFDLSTTSSSDLFWPFTGARSEAPIAQALPGGSEVGYESEANPSPDGGG